MALPRTTLGDYERGKTEPNIAMLIKMSDHFELKVDDLIRKNLSHEDLEILKNRDFRVLAITVDYENQGNIELVDTKAEYDLNGKYLKTFTSQTLNPSGYSDGYYLLFVESATYSGSEVFIKY